MSPILKRKPAISALDGYRAQMADVLRRIESARLQITESTLIEELDLGRSALQAAYAELQRIVRLAKEASGIPVRPVEEIEAQHRQLVERLHKQPAVPAAPAEVPTPDASA